MASCGSHRLLRDGIYQEGAGRRTGEEDGETDRARPLEANAQRHAARRRSCRRSGRHARKIQCHERELFAAFCMLGKRATRILDADASRPVPIVGADRERLMVTRRGRCNTVCATPEWRF